MNYQNLKDRKKRRQIMTQREKKDKRYWKKMDKRMYYWLGSLWI